MTAGGGVDYRVPRSKGYRLQAESYRYAAQADRLLADFFEQSGAECVESYVSSAATSERLACEYDRMAENLETELTATAGRASALAALEEHP